MLKTRPAVASLQIYLLVRRLTLIISLTFVANASAQIQFPQGEFPLTNFDISSVAIDEIMTGGPPRDGIPAIDKPSFVSIGEANGWLDAQEPVIAFSHKGVTRAYPLQILMYHEIVNDEIADTPISVTFCPLCNASIVFHRTVMQGDVVRVLDFGTTGRLRKSDLIMYDRQTESWWQQFTGQGIIGDYTNVRLAQLPSQIVSYGEFRKTFADAQVLSNSTGFNRPYGNNPYRGYDSIDSNPFLFRGDIDPRLPAMERVLSIRLNQGTHLIPLSRLLNVPLFNLAISDMAIAVFATTTAASALDAGRISESRAVPAAAAFHAVVDEQALQFELRDGQIIDKQTGSQWNAFGHAINGKLKGEQLVQLDGGVHFAFAWLAFEPDATIVKVQ